MKGVIIILLVTVSVGLLLYVYDLKWRRKHVVESDNIALPDAADADSGGESYHHNGGICCGRHLVCEKSLSPLPGEKPEYFDDEELDRFVGRDETDYSEEETEEFREVLLTMIPSDIAPWVRSLQLRNIAIPLAIRDELFMMLGDCDD